MSPSAAIKAEPKSSSSKSSKSRIVVLKLSAEALVKYPHEKPSPAPRRKSISSSAPSAPTPSITNNSTKDNNDAVAAEQTPGATDGADMDGTSTPAGASTGMLAPQQNAAKRKGVPGPKPGMKRTASQLDTNGVPKPRGKPGPKKKPRLGENGEVVNGAAVAAPKLGPKANQGAINACLRALDRTGKPCRKWVKKSFVVRSFTGYDWGSGSYAAPRKQATTFEGDVKSDTSSSGDKPTQDGSAMQSEKSTSGADVDTPMQAVGLTSSPAPGVAINASG